MPPYLHLSTLDLLHCNSCYQLHSALTNYHLLWTRNKLPRGKNEAHRNPFTSIAQITIFLTHLFLLTTKLN